MGGNAHTAVRWLCLAVYSHAYTTPQDPYSSPNLTDITILKRPSGEDWLVGQGAFGRVYKALRNGVQTVAVKVLLVVRARG